MKISRHNFSTLRDDFMLHPARYYAELRNKPLVFWSDMEGAWILHRYADIVHVMSDPRFSVVELAKVVGTLSEETGRKTSDLQAVLNEVLFLRNPPNHAEARQFLVAVLNNRPLSYYRAVIAQIAQSLLSKLPREIPIDITTHYADLIPPLFMGRLLGLEYDVIINLVQTVSEVTKTFDRGRSPRFYERVNGTVTKALTAIAEVIAARRQSPRDDGISRMITLSDERFFVSDKELATRSLFLIIGGVETTSALIGNLIASILDHPNSWSSMRANPDFYVKAVEEVLRYDGPVQQSTRIATVDCDIAGQSVSAGDHIVLLIGAAHRDPDIYDQPDDFNISRLPKQHLAFGAGMHFCIGAGLARIEAEIALRELMAIAPSLPTICHREWWRHRTLRRLSNLSVVIPL